ncbi:MAG: VTT domain-containing protein [Rhodocyclaceae bacterium]|nr:VTT domain-containing protein [Rhodocyclaceae bacterium]
MNLVEISESIHRDAVWVVFANVLLQQLGLPIPAVPTLMLAGSLALSYGFAGKVLAAAILASVVADWIWYVAGRAYGYGLLVGLCKLSINPGVCVTSAESLFSRWGAWALVGAKFVPGFSTVGPPIAGSLRLPLPTFMLAAGIGAGLWAGVAIFVGWLFRTEVHMVIETLSSNGMTTLGIATLIIVVWLAWKFWQRHRFERLARIPHISATELKAQREAGGPLLVLDLRGASAIAAEGPLDGTTQVQRENLHEAVRHWPKDQAIVTLCGCPEDATAVEAAHALMKAGYTAVRPLKGGFEAWAKMSEL